MHCLWTHKLHFSTTFSLKMNLTVLFTYLKIILLQCFSVFSFSFQFSVISKRTKVFYTSDWLSNSKVLELSLEFLCFIHWLEEVVCVWIFVANIPHFLTNQTKGSRRNRMGPGELHSQFRRAPLLLFKEMKSIRVRYGWVMWGKKFC